MLLSDALAAARPLLVRRGLWLNYLTLAYNTVEAIVSIAAGVVAGSVALVGFGVDSGIEVTASVAGAGCAHHIYLRVPPLEGGAGECPGRVFNPPPP